jgi:hypothetical protein
MRRPQRKSTRRFLVYYEASRTYSSSVIHLFLVLRSLVGYRDQGAKKTLFLENNNERPNARSQ